MSDLRLVHGSDVLEALKDEGEAQVYTYHVNTPVFVLAVIVSLANAGLAGMLWWNAGLGSASTIAGFAILVAVAVGLGIVALYWYSYTQTHFLGMSDEKVFVGGRDRMWCIDWSLLDRETLGFEEMSVGTTGGSLDLAIGSEQIEVRLYNTFIHLEDIQGFMFRILEHLKDDDQPELDPDDPEPDETDLDAGEAAESDDD